MRALPLGAVLAFLSSAVSAEDVAVKYRPDPVNLKHFECTDTVSSFVNQVCYDNKRRYLIILLNSTRYHWCDVGEETVKALLAAESKGRYFNNNIKGRFDCRLSRVPEY
jgi:hypothetical protein